MKKILLSLMLVVCAMPAIAADKAMPDMEKMMKLMAPSEHHQVLNGLVGTWDYTSQFKMSADAPAEKSSGSNTIAWVLDGRFLRDDTTGTMKMGDQMIPFTGVAYYGYDNVSEEYTSVWMDSFTTGMMTTKGTYDAATKTITYKGEMNCPLKGKKNMPFRSELTLIDEKHMSYAMYSLDDAGKEFKGMEILYTKKQ